MSEKKTARCKPTRQARLDAWFVRNGVKKSDVARMLGVSPGRVSQLLRGIYLTKDVRTRIVRELGVPDWLMPPPWEVNE